MAHYGVFNVFIQTNDAAGFNPIQTIVQRQIDDIAKTGVTQEELDRAKTYFKTRHAERKNTAESWGGQLAESAALGDWRLSFWHADNVAKSTLADTQRAAKAYLVESNRVRVSYIPDAQPSRAEDAKPVALGDYQSSAQTTNADVATSTGSDSAPRTELERFEPTALEIDKRTVRTQLAVGTRIALLPRPAVGDAIQGTLRIHWGSLEAMRGKGAAPIMGALITRQTSSHSGKALQDLMYELQSTVFVHSSVHGLILSFKTTREHWSAFAQLLNEILNKPVFSEPAFQSWKKQTIATLSQQRDEPASKTRLAMQRAMNQYDADDPRYEVSHQELIDRLNTLTLEQVQKFWTQFSGASVSEFAAVGALDVAKMQTDLTAILNNWHTQGGAQAYQRIAIPMQTITPKRIIVQTPGKPNASYDVGLRLQADPNSREGMALQLAHGIIGAGTSSRLYARLRSTEGLSYGTRSSFNFNPRDNNAVFGISGTYAPQNIDKFETALIDTLKEIQVNGLNQSELELAKSSFKEGTLANRNNDAQVVNGLVENERRTREGTASNYARYDALNEQLHSLTLEEINIAAKKLTELSKAVIVITGDFKN
jgi:zinc protease